MTGLLTIALHGVGSISPPVTGIWWFTRFYAYRAAYGAKSISMNYDGAITVLGWNITACHYGTEPKTVHVSVHHINVNRGFSIPIINDQNDDATVLTSVYVISEEIWTGVDPTKFFVICCQKQDEKMQLLIFRAATTSGRMVDLRSTDVLYMDTVAKW